MSHASLVYWVDLSVLYFFYFNFYKYFCCATSALFSAIFFIFFIFYYYSGNRVQIALLFFSSVHTVHVCKIQINQF